MITRRAFMRTLAGAGALLAAPLAGESRQAEKLSRLADGPLSEAWAILSARRGNSFASFLPGP